MKTLLQKVVIPTVLTLGLLGFVGGLGSSVAGAATRPAVPATASATWKGTVLSQDVAKDRFKMLTLKGKTFRVDFKSTTKWTKGTAADVKRGVWVSVTGTISKAIITATSIAILS